MKGKRYTEEQSAFALRQAESGVPAVEACQKMGVSEKTFYTPEKKYGGMGVCEPSDHGSSRLGNSQPKQFTQQLLGCAQGSIW